MSAFKRRSTPLPHPISPTGDPDRVVVVRDVRFADGRLKVEAGARGTVMATDQGDLWITFDESEHYCELSGCNQQHQRVAALDTAPEHLFHFYWEPAA